jgi:hypothetical protein
MQNKIVIKSPEGEKIELVSSKDENFAEGALLGAKSLLNLLQDDMDLEDGYIIEKVLEEEDSSKSSSKPFSEMFD